MATEIKASTGSSYDSASRTEQQRTRDGSPYIGDREAAQAGGRDLADKAADVGDRMAESARSAGQCVMDAGGGIAERAKGVHSTVCKFTKDNPMSSILIAFGVGAVLARVLPKW
jgi:ElaB/YqjD/DUF883 family membrane-anchored ribosome-binding protein